MMAGARVRRVEVWSQIVSLYEYEYGARLSKYAHAPVNPAESAVKGADS
jgi:hypothetical protein